MGSLPDGRININLKLYGHINDIIKEDFKGISIIIVPRDFTIRELIEYLGIPFYRIGLIAINESAANKYDQLLFDGDAVKIFPPLGGG